MKKNVLKKVLIVVVSIVIMCGMFTSCKTEAEEQAEFNKDKEHPVATITVKDYGVIVLELYQDIAPNTVANFISLAKSGFYNGLTFHRVINNFMIQGGDPDGNGSGGPGYSIKGEFSVNGFDNNLKHTPGVISMARSTPYDSAGSQFFICTGDCSHLDAKYAAFGKVTSGLDVAYEIAKQGSSYNSTPSEKIIIESITVDEKDGRYSVVEKLDEE